MFAFKHDYIYLCPNISEQMTFDTPLFSVNFGLKGLPFSLRNIEINCFDSSCILEIHKITIHKVHSPIYNNSNSV